MTVLSSEPRRRRAVLGLALGLAILAVGAPAGEAGPLLRPSDVRLSVEKRSQLEADPYAVRWRMARMDGDALPTAGPLKLNLFDDVAVNARVSSAEILESGSRFLAGALENGGHFTLLRSAGGILRAAFHTAHGVYTMRSQGPGQVLIKQHDVSKMPGCGVDAMGERPPRLTDKVPTVGRSQTQSPRTATAGQVQWEDNKPVDILVLYTQRVEDHEGGPVEVMATLENEIAKMNLVLANSGLAHRRVQGFFEKVDYDQGKDYGVDLSYLSLIRNGTLHSALIEKHQPDLLHLIVRDFRAVSGLASFPGAATAAHPYKRCATARQRINRYGSDDMTLCLYNEGRRRFRLPGAVTHLGSVVHGYTFAHEVGHNLGLAHGTSTAIEFPYRNYGYGYINPDVAATCQHTVMTTPGPECLGRGRPYVKVPAFSNADLFFPRLPAGYDSASDTPMGVPGEERTGDHRDPVNAARAIDEVWHLVSALSEPDADSLDDVNVVQVLETTAITLRDAVYTEEGETAIDLASYYAGPALSEVEFTATSNDSDVALAAVRGSQLIITPVARGEAEVTLRSVYRGRVTTQTFTVTVTDACPSWLCRGSFSGWRNVLLEDAGVGDGGDGGVGDGGDGDGDGDGDGSGDGSGDGDGDGSGDGGDGGDGDGDGVGDDHGDTFNTATTLALGGERSGTISPVGDVDWFRLDVEQTEGFVKVYTTGSTDTYGKLHDSESGWTTENNDGRDGGNFTLHLTEDDLTEGNFDSGIYYVSVEGYGGETGDYIIHAEFHPRDGVGGDDDHGHTINTATTLVLGGEQSGTIEEPGDSDVFKIDATEAGTVIAYTTGSMDTVGQLVNLFDTVTAQDDDTGEGRNFRISYYVAPGPGLTYFVVVSGYDVGTGDYTLHTEFEPLTAAKEIPLGEQSDTIGPVGDIDWFRINVTELGVLTAYTTPALRGFDLVGDLFNSVQIITRERYRRFNGNSIGGTFGAESIVYPGTYYVSVQSPHASIFKRLNTGSYTLHTELELPTTLALGGEQSGRLDPVNWFRIDITEPGTLIVYTTGSTTFVVGSLYEPVDGRFYLQRGPRAVTEVEGSHEFRMERLVDAGTYYVAIQNWWTFRGWPASGGSYTIHAEFEPN